VKAPFLAIRSVLPGVVWPAITRPDEARALALQYQLERSQWLPANDLRELQFRQLDALLRHAYKTVPYYRWQWHGAYASGDALTVESFGRLPLLRRGDLEHEFDALKSSSPPEAHGGIAEGSTAGSTGNPVRTLKTELAGLWWQVLTLRDHLWHRRDFSGTLAAIRTGVAEQEAEGWGPATDMIAGKGRSLGLSLRASLGAQLEWLQRHEPDYLLTYPSNVADLARLSLASGIRLSRLREVRTFGEPVTAETREACRQAWDVPLTDRYSTDEAGYIALQCPDHEHYHVQSESVLAEVLDERGRACAPGSVGRIVITTLQNYAMPLVRYDIGDLAEVGEACPCGRGLPVLRRIVGRT
jgi:phenylacetate-CoA ligase